MRERLCKLTLEEVLPYIGGTDEKNRYSRKLRHTFKDQSVKVSSLRLHTFVEKGLVCIKCKTKGQFFTLERTVKGNTWNLELYGITPEGEEVLITKDHIHPKSKGGKDHISNMQTMCHPCNCEKGNQIEEEEKGL